MSIANYFQFHVISQPDPKNPGKITNQILPGVHGLFSGGLVIDLLIGVDNVTASILQKNNISIPSPVLIKALFDTGCTITSIDQSLVTQLNLATRGFSPVNTANGQATSSQHLISIGFPGTLLNEKKVFPVLAANLLGQPIQALIGRDLMAGWTITYNGPAGFVSIAD